MNTRRMRTARRDIINFISVFVSKSNDNVQFTNKYANHLLTIAELYQNEPENIKEPEVIDLCANIVNNLDKSQGHIFIPKI